MLDPGRAALAAAFALALGGCAGEDGGAGTPGNPPPRASLAPETPPEAEDGGEPPEGGSAAERGAQARERAFVDLGPPEPPPGSAAAERWHRARETWTAPAGEGGVEATARALLRVCASEAELVSPADCAGIWTVAEAVRARHCDRSRSWAISQCGPDGEETLLSALRRLSPRAVGALPPRGPRLAWVQRLGLSCEAPEGYPRPRVWEARVRAACEEAARAALAVARGERPPRAYRWPRRAGRPIAWGIPCEGRRGACDDRLACARGLARVRVGPETRNAFWCRPGRKGCGPWLARGGRVYSDPVCVELDAPAKRPPPWTRAAAEAGAEGPLCRPGEEG